MKHFLLLFCIVSLGLIATAQSNIQLTNPVANEVLMGNYDPVDFAASNVIDDPRVIAAQLTDRINPDSLLSYLKRMSAFETRNTGSDTVSNQRGIGAARRWAHQKFEQFSGQSEGRLIPSYLQFDQVICGMAQHRNIVAVLPGRNVIEPGNGKTGIVIIEGHLDSRCDTPCDTNCLAEGMEDNGSGSALVLELARVMSKYTYDRTIVFMLTIGEEQGLYGADAMADFVKDNGIPVAAVLNNDVIGGVICGETSSAPSCPTENDIDSTQVRIFSAGTFNSRNKQLARYVKLQYMEELVQHVKVPQQITIMTAEDRQGRGGDHIPFRSQGYAAIRFTSANEHGDASNGAGYDDRQHTSEDVLGVDTDSDGQLDSFFVDFNYLARNGAINANAATMIAQNVCFDGGFVVEQINWHQVRVSIGGDWCPGPPYRIAIRTETNDFDTVLSTDSNVTIVEVTPGLMHFFSVCGVNENDIESLFTGEQFIDIVGLNEVAIEKRGIELLQNRPNPFDESTTIAFLVHDMPASKQATVRIADVEGRVIHQFDQPLQAGMNEVLYHHGYGKVGTFYYSLMIDNQVVDTKKMVFVAN